MRIAFLGTPEFAIPSLNVCNDFAKVVSVITQPDKESGRGKKIKYTFIKEEALKYNLEVFQPKSIKSEDSIKYLKSLDLDLMVVVAYGQILSKDVLDIPKYGCINVHASLLPKLRGAAPINWSIVNGDKITGVTTMKMDVGLDTGDMIKKVVVEIDEFMNAGELHDILMIKGAEVLRETLEDISNDKLEVEVQNDSLSTYAPMMNKKMAIINWKDDAMHIHNLIRGFNPWPVAYTKYKNEKVKIYESEVINEDYKKSCGEVVKVDDNGILIQTNNKCLLIKKLQFPNKKSMYIKAFLNGNSIDLGVVLGG
ncbi:MAG: methionyl-tRNA formyltransferase [Bacillota bacterium]|nr:methionyl-tRNA formyltransferase [Bacillota bacterium]